MVEDAGINYKKKVIWIKRSGGEVIELPFSRLQYQLKFKRKLLDAEVVKNGMAVEVKTFHTDHIFRLNESDFLDYKNLFRRQKRNDIKASLTKRIILEMKNNNVSKRELARALGTSPARILKILDVNFQNKSIDALMDICEYLGIKINIQTKSEVEFKKY